MPSKREEKLSLTEIGMVLRTNDYDLSDEDTSSSSSSMKANFSIQPIENGNSLVFSSPLLLDHTDNIIFCKPHPSTPSNHNTVHSRPTSYEASKEHQKELRHRTIMVAEIPSSTSSIGSHFLSVQASSSLPSQTEMNALEGTRTRRVSRTFMNISNCLLNRFEDLPMDSPSRNLFECVSNSSNDDRPSSICLSLDGLPPLMEAETSPTAACTGPLPSPSTTERRSSSSCSPTILTSSGNIDGKQLIERLSEMIRNKQITKVIPDSTARGSSTSPPSSPTMSSLACVSNGSSSDACLENSLIGPHVVECVLHEMLWPQHSFCTLVHLAAKYNNVDVLGWLKECCCDENCNTDEGIESPSADFRPVLEYHTSSQSVHSGFTSVNTPSYTCPSSLSYSQESDSFSRETVSLSIDPSRSPTKHRHSRTCLSRQQLLWNTPDNQSCLPLMYSVQEGAKEACVFLCSQASVQSQINFSRDRYGNLPIVMALKKKDYDLCDLLQLFGAKLDVTCGVGALGESLMHSALRERDIKALEYLARNNPKVILKKNQRDEVPLFRSLKDFRMAVTNTACVVNVPGYSQPKNLPHQRASCNGPRSSSSTNEHAKILEELLNRSEDWFGRELLEKALACKNSYGRSLFMEAVAINDVESTRVIAKFIATSLSKGCSRKLYEDLVFDRERINSANILHIAAQMVDHVAKQNISDYLYVLEGFRWLTMWLEETFLSTSPTLLYNMLSTADRSGVALLELYGKGKDTNLCHQALYQTLMEAERRWKAVYVQKVPTPEKLASKPSSNSFFSKFKNKLRKTKP